MYRFNPAVAVVFFFSLFFSRASAQCNLSDRTALAIGGVSVTNVTCPQNCTITVNSVTGGGGGDYVYEIFDGPVIRGIQSQNIFSALLPGNYKIRVTGCNGTFSETTATVGNYFLETAAQTQTFLSSESFKCNSVNNGKVRVNVNFSLPNNDYADSQFYKLPLRYQVSTNGDPSTGFSGSPYNSFAAGQFNTSFNLLRGKIKTISKFDTITGLSAGTTYYIRITDQCGVFKTTSITIPNSTSPVYTYSFQVKEPYDISGYGSMPAMKGNCIQWGELAILYNGSPVSSIPASNTLAPITAVLKRQDNGEVLSSRIFQAGTLGKSNAYGYVGTTTNNLIFDSVPRVPVTLDLIDQCGTTTTIPVNTPSVKQPFNLQAFTSCSSGSSYFALSTFNGTPSLPLKYKLYDNTNTLLVNRLIDNNTQYVFLTGAPYVFATGNSVSFIPSYGEYRIAYEDQCGMKDSIVFNFGASGGYGPPTFNFNAYQPLCSAGGTIYYNVDAVQTNSSPVSQLTITSGPGGLTYPRFRKGQSILTSATSDSYGFIYQYYFDSLVAGTYQVLVDYGCSQQTTTSFTINNGITGSPTGYLTFTPSVNNCSSLGATVKSTSNITSSDANLIISDPPFIRILNAPVAFLKAISISKNGTDPSLPFILGNMSADGISSNGIDTNAVMIYPKYTFMNVFGGSLTFPDGDYTVELYSKCTGTIMDTKSFSITGGAAYSKPNLGASSGYICESGTVKVVANPIGGKRPFLYQILLAIDQDLSHYSALQSDSVFILPSGTPPGTVYNLRAVDACNNSFTGQVVVNSFTGNLYMAVSSDCLGSPSRIVTGFIPGAVYTWTKPDGTVVVTNSNEMDISSFSVSDIGVYTVVMNALGGCISKGTGVMVGRNCYTVLPIDILNFTATRKNDKVVDLYWETANEILKNSFEVERSTDGVSWAKIGELAAKYSGGSTREKYVFQDVTAGSLKTAVVYYRIRQVDANGKFNYTSVKKVYFNTTFSLLKVYPSPFTSAVSIDFVTESTEQAVVCLYDMSGAEVSRSVMPVIKGVNHYQYAPVLRIGAGNYTLVLSQGTKRFTQMVTKMESSK